MRSGDRELATSRRILLLSQSGGVGKTRLGLGAAAMLAVRGDRSGYLEIGYAPRLFEQVNADGLRAVESAQAGVSLALYAGSRPGAEILLAVGRVPQPGAAPPLAGFLKTAWEEILPRADTWFVDWSLPFEYANDEVLERFQEVWCLSLMTAGEPNSARAGSAVSKWVDVPVLFHGDDVQGRPESDRYRRGGQAIVFQRGVGAVRDGVPLVLAEPYGCDAISIAEFVRERFDHE